MEKMENTESTGLGVSYVYWGHVCECECECECECGGECVCEPLRGMTRKTNT